VDGLDDDWCPDAYGDGAAHLGPALPSPRGVQAAPPVSDNLASVGWRVLGLIRGLFPFPFGPEPSLYAAPRSSRGKPWRWAALLRSQWAALERAALADLCYSTMHFRVVRHVVAGWQRCLRALRLSTRPFARPHYKLTRPEKQSKGCLCTNTPFKRKLVGAAAAKGQKILACTVDLLKSAKSGGRIIGRSRIRTCCQSRKKSG
jgi:hypothetical protein